MNQTFCAFGMLLALLVATTWAVNAGSQTTSRGRKPAATPTTSQILRSRHPGGAVLIRTLPAAPSPDAPAVRAQPSAKSIHSARVVLAEQHASYNAAMSGPDYKSTAESAPDRQPAGTSPALEAEEIVQLFATLSLPNSRSATAMPRGRRQWSFGSTATYVCGFQCWLQRQADRLPLVWLARQFFSEPVAASRPVSWDDYATLVDGLAVSPTAPAAARIELVATNHVQSGHWLLHSAASSWHRLALLLQLPDQRIEEGQNLAGLNTP